MPLLRSRISLAVLELFRKSHLVPPNCKVIISPYFLAHFDKVGPGFTGGIIGPTPTIGYPFGPSGYFPFEEACLKSTINLHFHQCDLHGMIARRAKEINKIVQLLLRLNSIARSNDVQRYTDPLRVLRRTGRWDRSRVHLTYNSGGPVQSDLYAPHIRMAPPFCGDQCASMSAIRPLAGPIK
jgi:hypothetical protein